MIPKRIYLNASSDDVQKITVYPSGVDLVMADGDSIWVEVGTLYLLMAAHMDQNGLWANIDLGSQPLSVSSKVDVTSSNVNRSGRVTSIKVGRP